MIPVVEPLNEMSIPVPPAQKVPPPLSVKIPGNGLTDAPMVAIQPDGNV